jgi:hypothetical protein
VEDNETVPIHKQYAHDIALIELSEPVDTSSPYIRTICLPLTGDPQFPANNLKRSNPNSVVNQGPSVDEYINHADHPNIMLSKFDMFNHIRRFKRHQSNSVELFDVENSDQCWVTGWGDTNGKSFKGILKLILVIFCIS